MLSTVGLCHHQFRLYRLGKTRFRFISFFVSGSVACRYLYSSQPARERTTRREFRGAANGLRVPGFLPLLLSLSVIRGSWIPCPVERHRLGDAHVDPNHRPQVRHRVRHRDLARDGDRPASRFVADRRRLHPAFQQAMLEPLDPAGPGQEDATRRRLELFGTGITEAVTVSAPAKLRITGAAFKGSS
jgi:hypothetical protein